MKFVNPALLFALSLIVIPILIHLFNLRKYKVVYFSNVRFLKELKEETKKQSRLKYLLVLLMRILTVIFLVLAFAQPYLPKNEEIIITEKDFISVYIDNSFSMEAEGEKGTLLQMAKEKAVEIVESFRLTDDFHILDNSFLSFNQKNFSKQERKAFIQDISYSYHFRTLSEVIKRQKSHAEKSNYKQQFHYIISDFQKSFTDLDKIEKDTTDKIFLIPIASKETANLFIDSCWFESPILREGQDVLLKVRIINLTQLKYEKIPVKLLVNKQQKAISSFDIEPNTEIVIEMPFKSYEKGIHFGVIEISDYPIVYDDKFYFSYAVHEKVSILCINNKTENKYLNILFKTDSLFTFTNVQGGSVDFSVFSAYNLIIINEFEDITTGMANELVRYIKGGGTLLLIPGDKIDLTSYNSFLSEMAQINISKADTGQVKINKINLSHPLYKNVFETIPDNISLPAVRMHYVINAGVKSNTESLLSLQNSNTFLSLSQVEKGRIYILSSPLNKLYSDFPLHGIFVPTLYNIAVNSVYSMPLYHVLGTSTSFAISNQKSALNDVYKIKNNETSYEFIPQSHNAFSGVVFHLNDMVEEAGNYLLLNNDAHISGLSFNYNRKESALGCYDKISLEALIKDSNLKNTFVLSSSKSGLGEVVSKINQGVLLWKYCIILALLFLLGEVILLRFWK